MAESFSGLSEEQLDNLIKDYFDGVFDTRHLPIETYNATIAKVSEGVLNGFGGSIDDFEEQSGEAELLKFFDHNVQQFSAAKTFQEAKDLTNAIFDADGFKRPFEDFKKDADAITEVYNDVWLRTEFETGSRMGFSSRQWLDATRDKELAPLLKYQTVGDERVRPEHVNLDNIVKPIKSSFWNTHFPPNGWRCRCITEQLFEDEEPETPKTELPPVNEIPPLFRMNPGKDKFIFNPGNKNSKGHPYFTVNKADEDFKKRNFGLPLTPAPKKSPNEPFKPDNYDKEIGVDMGDNFFPLLKRKTELSIIKNGTSFHRETTINGISIKSEIKLNTKRNNTDTLKKLIVAHEFGHAIHTQNGWLAKSRRTTPSGFAKLIVDPALEKTFRKWEKKLGGIPDKKKRELILHELYLKTDSVSFNDALSVIRKKGHPPGLKWLKWDKEAPEYWGSLMDTIGALTRNAVGYGHTKTYLNKNQGYGARAEFFAHSSENYFVGNPFMEELFPEMNEDMKKMINTLIKKDKKPPK